MEKRIEKYKNNETWKNDIAEKHRLDPEEVPALLDAFHLDMRCKKLTVRNLPYFFDNWLETYISRQNEEMKTAANRKNVEFDREKKVSSPEYDVERLDRQQRERDEAYEKQKRAAVKPAVYIRSLGYDPQKVGMQQVLDPEWRATHPPTLTPESA